VRVSGILAAWSALPTALSLASCGGGGSHGADNQVVTAVTPTGPITSYVNKTQAISVVFTTSDGATASTLTVSGLASLPAGWSAASTMFTCSTVSTGSGCRLMLTYAPDAAGSGTLTVDYSYSANNGAMKNGAVSIPYSAQPPTLELLAGSIAGTSNGDGTGAAARFSSPTGIAADSAGNLYVVDTGLQSIRKITAQEVVTTIAGGGVGRADGVGTMAKFANPQGVVVDASGTLYVADFKNYAIRKITPDGTVTTLAGHLGAAGHVDGAGDAARFSGPVSIAIDGSGTLYVGDQVTIRKVTPQGTVSTLAGSGQVGSSDGTGAAASFNNLQGIAVDSNGTIYVTDLGNYTVRKVTAQGVVTTLAGLAGMHGYVNGTGAAARFDLPVGIAVDAAGTLFVCDEYDSVIRQITPQGVVTTFAGGGSAYGDGTGLASGFDQPRALTFDGAGTMYVSDTGAGTIRKVTTQAVVTTVAGSPFIPVDAGYVDGLGPAARFYGASGVVVDSGGTVYVTDTNNNTIRKITPQGAVTTLAGNARAAGFADGTGTAAQFNEPSGIAINIDGSLRVADTQNYAIRAITLAGVVTTLPISPYFRPVFPQGIAIDSSGTIYVTQETTQIGKVTPDNVFSIFAGEYFTGVAPCVDGPAGTARFEPQAITVNSAGVVNVLDMFWYTVRAITPAGMVTTLAGSADACTSALSIGNAPDSIAVDGAGNVYVAGYGVIKISADGTSESVLFPQTPPQMLGVAVRADGQLVITTSTAILVTRGL
jgi:sugar lactone lactonase YvrE